MLLMAAPARNPEAGGAAHSVAAVNEQATKASTDDFMAGIS